MLILWLILSTLFIYLSEWLLITVLLLEVITFYILSLLSIEISSFIISDYILICYFRVFVIEGVIALAGLIILVRFSGSDYLRSSSLLKC
jgi:hypothetical protein